MKKSGTIDLTKYQIAFSKATEKAKLKHHTFKKSEKWALRKPRN